MLEHGGLKRRMGPCSLYENIKLLLAKLQPTLDKSSIFSYACRVCSRKHIPIIVPAGQMAIEGFLKMRGSNKVWLRTFQRRLQHDSIIGDMNWIPIEVGRNKHYTAHERIQNFLQQTALPPAGVLARRRWRWSRWWPGRRRVMCIRVPASASAGAPSELRIGSFKSNSNPDQQLLSFCFYGGQEHPGPISNSTRSYPGSEVWIACCMQARSISALCLDQLAKSGQSLLAFWMCSTESSTSRSVISSFFHQKAVNLELCSQQLHDYWLYCLPAWL